MTNGNETVDHKAMFEKLFESVMVLPDGNGGKAIGNAPWTHAEAGVVSQMLGSHLRKAMDELSRAAKEMNADLKKVNGGHDA